MRQTCRRRSLAASSLRVKPSRAAARVLRSTSWFALPSSSSHDFRIGTAMSDILERIIDVKRAEVRAAEQSAPLEALRLEASARDHRDFVGALRAKHAAGKPA